MTLSKYIYLALAVVLAASSCQKHEIEFNTTATGDLAEFQLHYFVPVVANTDNNIYKVEINNEIYANATAPLETYNAIPKGSTGRFYTVNPGEVNIKLYKGNNQTLVYDEKVTLTAGKQNIFVHDFGKVPTVFNNGYPYTVNTTENTDSVCYIKFYNFLYETPGVPCPQKVQYQYTNTRTGQLVNAGRPVAFGEATEWIPIKVIKSEHNSSGSNRIDFKIKAGDAGGNFSADLQVWNSKNTHVPYSGFQTEYIGRRYHHVLSGMRSATPIASVRQFTGL